MLWEFATVFHLFRVVHEFDSTRLINCTPNQRGSVVENYVFDRIYILSLQDSPGDKGPPPALPRPNIYSRVMISKT